MTTIGFLQETDALKRYCKKDKRTLRAWATRGQVLYQVINPESRRPVWLYESPEARYERMMGLNNL